MLKSNFKCMKHGNRIYFFSENMKDESQNYFSFDVYDNGYYIVVMNPDDKVLHRRCVECHNIEKVMLTLLFKCKKACAITRINNENL